MKIAIIDDEPLAVELLVHYVQQIPYLELVGTWNNAIEAQLALPEAAPDLLLLDIQMPGMTGMQLAQTLPAHTMVIFTTAFPQYALEGYQVNTVDYLLKPISQPIFQKAITKAWGRYRSIRPDEAFIFVRANSRQIRIHLRDILYIESMKDYVRIHLNQQVVNPSPKSTRNVVTMVSMKTLETCLPSPQFMRVHRSFIVNMSMITSLGKQGLLVGDTCIPISDSYHAMVMGYVQQHSLGR